MKFRELRPIIWTDKLQESIKFYTHTLGFICSEQNEDWGWASLQKDGVEIMLSKPNEHFSFEKPVFTGSFYITTDNVDEAWEILKDKATIVYPIENFDWQMRKFALYDNNGYIIQFGQDISTISS